MKKRTFSLNERKEIEKYLADGLSYEALGKKINRSRSSLQYEIFVNGGRANYIAENAQKRAASKKTHRMKNLLATAVENLPIKKPKMNERLEIVEQHIKIIMDFLKL